MNPKIVALLEEIDRLENKLESEFEKRRTELGFGDENGRTFFDEETLRRQLEFKTGLIKYVQGLRIPVLLTAPVIYGMIVPFVLIDLTTLFYQAVCFPVYGIELVRRRDYFAFDRRHLVYMNVLEKLNCAYCAYANGVVGFIGEVGARTEKYWCPVKHARRLRYVHSRYAQFFDYGDAEAYKAYLDAYLAERNLPRAK